VLQLLEQQEVSTRFCRICEVLVYPKESKQVATGEAAPKKEQSKSPTQSKTSPVKQATKFIEPKDLGSPIASPRQKVFEL